MIALRWVARLVRPVCRLVERSVTGWAVERAEAKLRHPAFRPVRVVDLADAAIDLSEFEAQFDSGTQVRAAGTYRLLDEYPGRTW